MGLLHVDLPIGLAIVGWLLLVPAVWRAVRSIRADAGGFIRDPMAQHVWLAGAVGIAFVWSLSVGTSEGMRFGIIGAALYGLLFGPARAFLGLLAALAVHIAFTQGAWLNIGINGLLFALVPVMVSSALQRLLEARLPHNLFVFIIGNGLFVTLAATAVTGLLLLATAVLALPPGRTDQLGDYVAYTLLLAWGEALLSGMIFSALVVFRPAAVLTFSQDIYLPRRRW